MPKKGKDLLAPEKAMEQGIYLRPGVCPSPETIQRVEYIAEQLAKGKSDTNMRRWLIKECELTDKRTLDSYLTAAYRLLTPVDWDEEKTRIVSKNIKTLETIIDKTMDKEQYKLAREAIDSLNRMFGVGGSNGVVINKNDKGDEQIIISFD